VADPAPVIDVPRRGSIPDHSPYRHGDWVRVHAQPHAFPPGPTQHGWRGYVTGGFGSTILVGVTDDGRPWAEYWGALEPDTPRPPGKHCVCCRRERHGGGVVVTRSDAMWWRCGWGARPIAELWDGTDTYPAVIR
jgi:hypothetical protein